MYYCLECVAIAPISELPNSNPRTHIPTQDHLHVEGNLTDAGGSSANHNRLVGPEQMANQLNTTIEIPRNTTGSITSSENLADSRNVSNTDSTTVSDSASLQDYSTRSTGASNAEVHTLVETAAPYAVSHDGGETELTQPILHMPTGNSTTVVGPTGTMAHDHVTGTGTGQDETSNETNNKQTEKRKTKSTFKKKKKQKQSAGGDGNAKADEDTVDDKENRVSVSIHPKCGLDHHDYETFLDYNHAGYWAPGAEFATNVCMTCGGKVQAVKGNPFRVCKGFHDGCGSIWCGKPECFGETVAMKRYMEGGTRGSRRNRKRTVWSKDHVA